MTWDERKFALAVLKGRMEALERAEEEPDSKRKRGTDSDNAPESTCTVPEYVDQLMPLLVGEVLAQVQAAVEENYQSSLPCCVTLLKHPRRHKSGAVLIKTWTWTSEEGWLATGDSGGGPGTVMEITCTVYSDVRRDQYVFFKNDLLAVSQRKGRGGSAPLAFVQAVANRGPEAEVRLVMYPFGYTEEQVEEMVGKPLTLFLTKLCNMVPALREVSAVCGMGRLPAPLLKCLLAPAEACEESGSAACNRGQSTNAPGARRNRSSLQGGISSDSDEGAEAAPANLGDHTSQVEPKGATMPPRAQPQVALSEAMHEYVATCFDRSQQQAILNCCPVVAADEAATGGDPASRVHLVQGPPGTGKTHLICGIVSCWLQDNSCAPEPMTPGQHGCSDSLEGEMEGLPIPEQASGVGGVRGGSTRHQSKHSAPRQQEEAPLVPPRRVLICAQSNAGVDEVLTRLDKRGVATSATTMRTPCMVREGPMDVISEAITHLHPDRIVAGEKGDRDITSDDVPPASKQDREELLKRVEVLATTLNSAGGDVVQLLGASSKKTNSKLATTDALRFDVLIVDEATQATEPSLLIPLNLLKKDGHIVLVGDQKQLAPTVISENGRLAISLFARLLDSGFPYSMLQMQYRMHPHISYLPAQMFYDGLLYNGVEHADRALPMHRLGKMGGPLVVFNIRGGRQERHNTSLRNVMEATFLLSHLDDLFGRRRQHSEGINSIMILSPYKGQVDYLKKRLEDDTSNACHNCDLVEVCTIDGSQGREADLVVLTCVRAPQNGVTYTGVGFLKDKRRMNVALTRARRTLWVICNKLTLSKDTCWRRLLTHAASENVFYEIYPSQDEESRQSGRSEAPPPPQIHPWNVQPPPTPQPMPELPPLPPSAQLPLLPMQRHIKHEATLSDRIRESLRRVREGEQDMESTMELEAHVEAHPGVQWVEGLEAVTLKALDPEEQASGPLIFAQLRRFFLEAVGGKQPWHSMLQCLPEDVRSLTSHQAIRRVDIWSTKTAPPSSAQNGRKVEQPRVGRATVIVATRGVAELLHSASHKPELSRAGVELVTKTKQTVQNWELEQEQEPVAVKELQIMDMDPSEEPVERMKKGKYKEDYQYKASKLWSVPVARAHLDLLKRSLVLICATTEVQDSLLMARTGRIAFQIASIKHVKCMADSGGRFLALRTRRPPHLLSSATDAYDEDDEAVGQQFEAAVDPSDCEAFASPTAYFCVRFENVAQHNELLELLEGFRVKIYKKLKVLAREPSRHASSIPHRLPRVHKEHHFLFPLTREDVLKANDSEFRIQYALECLLRHGHLRSENIGKLLEYLRHLLRWEVCGKYSEELEALVRELPIVHRCNDGTLALSKVKAMYDAASRLRRAARSQSSAANTLAPFPSAPKASVMQQAPCASANSSTTHITNRAASVATGVAAASDVAIGANAVADDSSTPVATSKHGKESLSAVEPLTPDATTHDDTANSATPPAGGVGLEAGNTAACSAKGGEDGTPDGDDGTVLQQTQGSQPQVWLRKVLVTPLRVLPYPETPEESNRILRRYAKYADRFLRVAFANESFTGLSHFELSDAVEDRVRDILQNGLRICNRSFVFLGYSNSQLKQHSCWLYCQTDRHLDGAPSAAEIRDAAGDFSHIRVPSYYAARFAQCFSTTYETLTLHPSHVCDLPEVLSKSNEMFSDGVGVITSQGMELVIRLLPVRQQQALMGRSVAAVQIRMGGCKGVLARWDNVSGMREGAFVGVRKSMLKFVSQSMKLEVCAISRVISCVINRQFMMALLSLGLDPEVLWAQYTEYVQCLDCLLDGSTGCLQALKVMGCMDPSHAAQLGMASGALAGCILQAGLRPQDDPFLMSLVRAYRRFALKGVVEKCRLPVRKGVVLIGIMDETGELPSGTFWACWDRPDDVNPYTQKHPEPLPAGTRAVVGRNPVTSPADLRILKAADPESLPEAVTSLHNVVVFPKVGKRPEQCKMSGGDLDGDIFFIIWDEDLIPEADVPANDYRSCEEPREVPNRVTVPHMVSFFLNFIRNDQVGRICNFHLAIADASPVYANEHRCEALAMLNSIAVDFGKTGVPVDFREVNKLTGGVVKPDYMGGTKRASCCRGWTRT